MIGFGPLAAHCEHQITMVSFTFGKLPNADGYSQDSDNVVREIKTIEGDIRLPPARLLVRECDRLLVVRRMPRFENADCASDVLGRYARTWAP